MSTWKNNSDWLQCHFVVDKCHFAFQAVAKPGLCVLIFLSPSQMWRICHRPMPHWATKAWSLWDWAASRGTEGHRAASAGGRVEAMKPLCRRPFTAAEVADAHWCSWQNYWNPCESSLIAVSKMPLLVQDVFVVCKTLHVFKSNWRGFRWLQLVLIWVWTRFDSYNFLTARIITCCTLWSHMSSRNVLFFHLPFESQATKPWKSRLNEARHEARHTVLRLGIARWCSPRTSRSGKAQEMQMRELCIKCVCVFM